MGLGCVCVCLSVCVGGGRPKVSENGEMWGGGKIILEKVQNWKVDEVKCNTFKVRAILCFS